MKRYLYRCYACGEAENTDFSCDYITSVKHEPENCPVSGDECEWVFKEEISGG